MGTRVEDIVKTEDIRDFYHFEDQIGQSMNKVVQAVNYETGEEVAIKIIDIGALDDYGKKNLYNELFSLATLQHPNIVELKEAYEDQEKKLFFIVTELLKGGILTSTIYEYQFLEEEKAARILKPVVDAIRYMHEKGIVHRDMKVLP
jgi:serine/threonine protein kinase